MRAASIGTRGFCRIWWLPGPIECPTQWPLCQKKSMGKRFGYFGVRRNTSTFDEVWSVSCAGQFRKKPPTGKYDVSHGQNSFFNAK